MIHAFIKHFSQRDEVGYKNAMLLKVGFGTAVRH